MWQREMSIYVCKTWPIQGKSMTYRGWQMHGIEWLIQGLEHDGYKAYSMTDTIFRAWQIQSWEHDRYMAYTMTDTRLRAWEIHGLQYDRYNA